MNPKALRSHGEHVHRYARAVPNMGRIGDLTKATVELLHSEDWRDYSDATGAYHFLPGEFDYFLALQTVEARDVARFYLTVEERAELAMAMDRSRTAEAGYRRSRDEVALAHPHAAKSLHDYWTRFGWEVARHPVGARALVRVKTGLTVEEHARRERQKRLRRLRDDWRERVGRVLEAADGFTRAEIFAAIDALRQLSRKAPKIMEEGQRGE
jgi:hypothetical protein